MKMSASLYRFLWSGGLALSLCACAAVQHTSTHFEPVAATADATQRVLAQGLEIQLDTGYRRSLKPGSHWIDAGHVPQGEVYKPYKDVLTLEGAQIHEAYLVVDGGVRSEEHTSELQSHQDIVCS